MPGSGAESLNRNCHRSPPPMFPAVPVKALSLPSAISAARPRSEMDRLIGLPHHAPAWKPYARQILAGDWATGAGVGVVLRARHCPGLDVLRMNDSWLLVALFHRGNLSSSERTSLGQNELSFSSSSSPACLCSREPVARAGRAPCRSRLAPQSIDRPRWPDLAGERSPTTRSVIHLRAGHSSRFDLLGVLDSRLFVSLLHKPPSFGSIRFRTLKLASCSESRETLNAAAF